MPAETNQLNVTHTGTETIYAIVRNVATGGVADRTNGDWATWADGSIGDYDYPLTDLGGDFHAADFPIWVSAGTLVKIQYYIQAGVAPALTDYAFGRPVTAYWTGRLVTETVGAGTDLTSVANVKSLLGETSSTYDTILGSMVTAISREMERVCGVHFAADDYSQWMDGRGSYKLMLPEAPIIYIVRACVGRQSLLNVSCSATDAARAMVRVSSSSVTLIITGGGDAGTNALALATYTTIGTLQAAIEALSGWSASLAGATDPTGNYPSTDLMEIPGWDLAGSSLSLSAPSDPLSGFRMEMDEGILIRDDAVWPAGNANVFVEYRAGYATLPADLDMAARQLVANLFRKRLLDGNLQSERLGDHAWTQRAAAEVEAERDGLIAPWIRYKLA